MYDFNYDQGTARPHGKAGQSGEIAVTDRGHFIAVIQPVPNSPPVTDASVKLWLNRRMSPEVGAEGN